MEVTPHNLVALLPALEKICRECGGIIRENWEKPHEIRHKGVIDLVTETDVAVQESLEPMLAGLLPEAEFIGEEGEDSAEYLKRSQASLAWIADPVDGTTNFAHGMPQVSLSVALCGYGRPLLGVVYAPMLNECFTAAKGHGAFLNGRPVKTSTRGQLNELLVATGFPYDFGGVLDDILNRLRRVLPTTQGLRRLGSAALDLAYVASGRVDVFYEAGLKPWDMAAGWLLVEEAGGIVSDFNGASMVFGASLLAANPQAHAAMLKLLAD